MDEEKFKKMISEAFDDADIFVTEVSPGLFRIGMGKGNPPVYTGREGVLALNKAMREEFERQYGKKGD